jgi:hypothetical protein
MHAQSTFFHQGSDLFADVEPFLKNVAAEVLFSPFGDKTSNVLTLIHPSFITVIRAAGRNYSLGENHGKPS